MASNMDLSGGVHTPKGKLQPENKLILHGRAFKICNITGIGQGVLELSSF